MVILVKFYHTPQCHWYSMNAYWL